MMPPQSFEPPVCRPGVLIIENDSESCQRLQAALERDYHLTIIHSGLEALTLLRQKSFDLVLMDIAIPDIAGLELLNRIRSTALVPDMPIILISPKGNDKDIVRGLQQGANDYVAKPFEIDLLRARMKTQLGFKKRLDEQQQTITDLKSNQELKDRFLRIATHDLKNPLNNILLAHFQLRNVVGTDPEATEALDAIEDTVHSMSDLVADYLDTALLESGSPELDLESVDVQQAIAEVVMRYSITASRKNISLHIEDTPGVAFADYGRLVQILNNLVSNAIKFSSPDTTITLMSEIREKQVRICVADQGPGIPADEHANLFKPFSKLSPRPTGGESSTGLGLWIVNELATLQNGTVSLDCPAEGGCVFRVDLPAFNE